MAVKSAAEIAAKYTRVASQRSQDYVDGIAGTDAQQFETALKNAESNWQAGVQLAVQRKAFGKGASGAGAKWKQNAQALGSSRYSQGVANAAEAYAQGFEPYRQTIASTTLPPRGPKGDPRNFERAKKIAEALRARKLAQ
jgi:hypothetical protein